jgi:hypothetical protein
VAASATAPTPRKLASRPSRDPWADLARPLTDSEAVAISRLHEQSKAAVSQGKIKTAGWAAYSNSRNGDFYTPKLGAEVKAPTQIDLTKSNEKSKAGFLFNAMVYSILQVKGQIWLGDVARLMAFTNVFVYSHPLVATRILSVTNAPVRWDGGWLQIDPTVTLPAMQNQPMYAQLAAGVLAA